MAPTSASVFFPFFSFSLSGMCGIICVCVVYALVCAGAHALRVHVQSSEETVRCPLVLICFISMRQGWGSRCLGPHPALLCLFSLCPTLCALCDYVASCSYPSCKEICKGNQPPSLGQASLSASSKILTYFSSKFWVIGLRHTCTM